MLSTPPLPCTMQAAIFHAPGDVRMETVPVPQLQPGELLVRVDAALTCGTDLKCYRRGHPVLLGQLPSPFGHEGAGTIVATTPQSTTPEGGLWQPGQRVVFANSAPCGTCHACMRGRENLCESLALLNGTYAQYIRIPERIAQRNTYALADTCPAVIAAFAEPLADALRGISVMQLQPGQSLLVMGLGPIGQLMVRAAKHQGLHVVATARSAHKVVMAQTFGGADAVVQGDVLGTETQDQLRALSPHGQGFDGVIEAIGQPASWQVAVDLVCRGGVVNWYGGCPSGTTVTLDTRRLHYDDIRLVSPFHHTPAFFAQAVQWLNSGQLDPSPLISQTVPLAKVVDGLEAMASGEAIKVALTMPH